MLQRLNDRLRKDQGGFTLIELLVVIIIIGILLAIAVPSYIGFRNRANQNAAQANVRSAVPAVEAYYADNGTYVGMDTADITAIDASVKVTVDAAPAPGASTYCIENTEPAGTTYHKSNPSGAISSGACP
jgi:type IV pilus assembly protein PilA